MARGGLTPRQRAFVSHFLVDLNATAAAIRAGYKPSSAAEVASRLVKKSQVSRAIREGMQARAARTRVTADKVVRELAVIAFSDVRHYEVADDGRLRVRRFADRGAGRAVASVRRKVRTVTRSRGDDKETETTVETEFRLWDKVRALDLLCQHLGMLKTPGPDPIHDLIAKLPADVARNLRALLGLDGAAGAAAGPGG